MPQSTPEEVRDFLLQAKRVLSEANRLLVVGRAKNNQALTSLGWTRRDQENLIYSLAVEDYCKGPESDRDEDGELWVFGPKRDGQQLYIKVKLVGTSPRMHLKCISFHLAEAQLALPYSEEK